MIASLSRSVWSLIGNTCSSYKFGHEVAPLALQLCLSLPQSIDGPPLAFVPYFAFSHCPVSFEIVFSSTRVASIKWTKTDSLTSRPTWVYLGPMITEDSEILLNAQRALPECEGLWETLWIFKRPGNILNARNNFFRFANLCTTHVEPQKTQYAIIFCKDWLTKIGTMGGLGNRGNRQFHVKRIFFQWWIFVWAAQAKDH